MTSVADLSRPDNVPQPDTSDSDDSISDITDYTEESFLEAFDSTNLDNSLLALAIDIKEHITFSVIKKVLTILGLDGGEDGTTTGYQNTYRASNDAAGNGSGSQPPLAGNRKRAFNGDGSNGSEGGDGDDQGKRPRFNSSPRSRINIDPRRLACPFYKQSPEKKWDRSCYGPGWVTIHRLKCELTDSSGSKSFWY
jgi:hypothetical protein